MGVMRNAVANVSAGWWAVDLEGKLTDVILFFFFSFVGFFSLVPRGRSNRRIGTFRHPSTWFWSMLPVWQTKSSCPRPSVPQILAGFVFEFFYLLFLSHSTDTLRSIFTVVDSPIIASALPFRKTSTSPTPTPSHQRSC
jgi:hypothetical protein